MSESKVRVTLRGAVDPSFGALERRMGGLISDLRFQIASLVGVGGFGSLVKLGVDFNVQLRQAQRTLAVIFRQNDPAISSFEAAMTRSEQAVAAIKERALKSSADFSDLMLSYSMNAGAMFAAGIKDLNKQIELVALLGDAIRSQGLGGPQFIQEVRAIFSGQLQGAQVARTLFNTPELVAQYRAALKGVGENLGDLLLRRLAPYREAADKSAGDFDVVVSNFKEAVQSLSASLLEGPMKDFTEWLKDFTDTIKTENFKGLIQSLIRGLQDLTAVLLVRAGYRLTERLSAGGVAANLKGALGTIGIGSVVEILRNAWDTGAAFGQQRVATEGFLATTENIREGLQDAVATALAEGVMKDAGQADWWINEIQSAASMAQLKQLAKALRETIGPVKTPQTLAEAAAATQWKGKLPWDTGAGKSAGDWMTRGWLTQGSARLWTRQLNYARDMAGNLGRIAEVVQRYLPKLAEEV